ncbi:MAG: hypothetical protein M1833_001213 [Piccolia ochrophora]|nr:MAG: hypothetical protein M1833_001213 [Piccolia ochrophora]
MGNYAPDAAMLGTQRLDSLGSTGAQAYLTRQYPSPTRHFAGSSEKSTERSPVNMGLQRKLDGTWGSYTDDQETSTSQTQYSQSQVEQRQNSQSTQLTSDRRPSQGAVHYVEDFNDTEMQSMEKIDPMLHQGGMDGTEASNAGERLLDHNQKSALLHTNHPQNRPSMFQVGFHEQTLYSDLLDLANDETLVDMMPDLDMNESTANFDLLGSFGIPTTTAGMSETVAGSAQISVETAMQPVSWHSADFASNTLDRRQSMVIAASPQGASIDLGSPWESPRPGTYTDSEDTSHTPLAISNGKPPRDHEKSQDLFRHLKTDEALIKILQGYPSLMLQKNVYPPFVHHKLYRCVEGAVAEPLANAFCCLSAYNAVVPSSEEFVQGLINAERDRIVKCFVSISGPLFVSCFQLVIQQLWSSSCVDMLAAVHAMCVYQIVGFFNKTRPEQTKYAELQHLFFLKMSRRLAKQHLASNGSNVSTTEDWRQWLTNETIRRTLFLVHMINSLSCRLHKQDPYWYEPLDEGLISEMALPAPSQMWSAATAEEWEAAKMTHQARFPRDWKLADAVDLFKMDGNDEDSARLERPHSADDKAEFTSLLAEPSEEFTRLIIACALSIRD